MRRLFLFLSAVLLLHAQTLSLPVKQDSVRFLAFGDMGTGKPPQYELAQRMRELREKFPFTFVLMLGDNIYGGKSDEDLKKKFETPYKPLLDAGVQFYASLGNHDDTNERFYKYFGMNGQRYYSFKKGNVRFFALDSNYMDPDQLRRDFPRLIRIGRSAISIIRFTRRERHTDRRWNCARFWNPCSSNTGCRWCSPDMTTFTSA